jgi:methylmalonyl-CoA mutase cobalamin-binding subunit
MKRAGLDVPVIVGGIIPPEDAAELERAALRRFTRRRISS